MSKELFDAVQMLAQEKGIPEDYLYEKISAAIVVAAKHDYNGKDIVHCDIDPEKQRFKVYVTKNVVEEVEDPDTDLTLEEAQAIKKSAKVGKTIDIPLKTKEFGSIIAQTAKHVIRQGIREAERGKLMEEYQSKKNIITRALGSHDYTAADIFEEPVVPGDLLLLCSDGLTNMVGDDAIFEIAKGAASLEEKTNVLIEQANENGGQDNISVILASVE